MDIQTLNEQFANDNVSFSNTGDDFTIVNIHNEYADASISMQGAQVISWTPTGEMPVIWISDKAYYQHGKSVRGGVPVCWPWFGAHATDDALPAHGFVRTQNWNLQSVQNLQDGSTALIFGFDFSTNTYPWGSQCELSLKVIIGQRLEMQLQTKNLDQQALTLTEALHTYFRVSDVRQVTITGLEDCRYLDKVDAFNEKKQTGEITIDSEVDRVYLDTSSDCIIEDSGLQRKIIITKSGSLSTVVWNPWEQKTSLMKDMEPQDYLDMLCVETANAATNAIIINAGETHTMNVVYAIERF